MVQKGLNPYTYTRSPSTVGVARRPSRVYWLEHTVGGVPFMRPEDAASLLIEYE